MNAGQGRFSRTRRHWRFWLGLTLAGIVILFTFQNVAVVQVALLFWAVRLPLAILLFTVFAAGAVAGWLFSRARRPR